MASASPIVGMGRSTLARTASASSASRKSMADASPGARLWNSGSMGSASALVGTTRCQERPASKLIAQLEQSSITRGATAYHPVRKTKCTLMAGASASTASTETMPLASAWPTAQPTRSTREAYASAPRATSESSPVSALSRAVSGMATTASPAPRD